tara:strand:- start:419 stop:715 length:297 start_codon:yes stop_codon:yes gene_type:complete
MSYDDIEVGDLIQYRDRWTSDPLPTGTEIDAWGEVGIVLQITSWLKSVSKTDKVFSVDYEHPKDAIIYVNTKGVRSMAKIDDVTIIRKGVKNGKKQKK